MTQFAGCFRLSCWPRRQPYPITAPLPRDYYLIIGGVGDLALTLASFIVAAGVNTACVALQERAAWFARRFGSRGWYVHLAMIAPGWLLFLTLQAQLGRHLLWPLPPWLRPIGAAASLVGLALVADAAARLGFAGTLNGHFFGRGPKQRVGNGTFRWLRNPMYDGFFLLFVGEALLIPNAVYLVLAAESVLLLNLFEARVENRPFLAASDD